MFVCRSEPVYMKIREDNVKLLWGCLLQGSSRRMTGEVTSADTYWPIHYDGLGAEVYGKVSTSKVTLQLRPHLQPDKPIVTANKTILILQVATGAVDLIDQDQALITLQTHSVPLLSSGLRS